MAGEATRAAALARDVNKEYPLNAGEEGSFYARFGGQDEAAVRAFAAQVGRRSTSPTCARAHHRRPPDRRLVIAKRADHGFASVTGAGWGTRARPRLPRSERGVLPIGRSPSGAALSIVHRPPPRKLPGPFTPHRAAVAVRPSALLGVCDEQLWRARPCPRPTPNPCAPWRWSARRGAGKTTLLEAMLLASGAIDRRAGGGGGEKVGDTSPEAKARGHSVELNLAGFDFMGDHYAVVDCPGSLELAAEADAALPAVDLAVIVADPEAAKAALLQPIVRQLEALGVPARAVRQQDGPGARTGRRSARRPGAGQLRSPGRAPAADRRGRAGRRASSTSPSSAPLSAAPASPRRSSS